jgi:hypothetical protein
VTLRIPQKQSFLIYSTDIYFWQYFIRKDINCRGWLHGSKISPEIGCLLRKHLSNQDIIDLELNWIVTMHEPIKDSEGVPNLLSVDRLGGSILGTDYVHPGNQWHDAVGFVCVVSQDAQG